MKYVQQFFVVLAAWITAHYICKIIDKGRDAT